MMTKVLLMTLLSLSSIVSRADNETLLWPLQNEKTGANILYKPQDYIGDELNSWNLLIEAAEGSVVLCPVDGFISDLGVTFNNSLQSCFGWRCPAELTSLNSRLEYVKKVVTDKSINQKYIHGVISIRYGNKTIHIGGLTGDEEFKTGQKIKKGTPIGKVGYSYSKIPKPCIDVTFGPMKSDPMAPFGLKSSYIPPKEIKPIKFLTKEQVREDFLIYINTLKEVFPGLYDILTKEELENYIAEKLKYIDSYKGNISIKDFGLLMAGARAKIHDSHIYLRGYAWKHKSRPNASPAIIFGWFQDTLMCTFTSKGYEKYLKKKITSINGISADSMKVIARSCLGVYDAKVKEHIECQLGIHSVTSNFFQDDNYDMEIEFTDGEVAEIKSANWIRSYSEYTPTNTAYYRTNKHGGKNYAFKEINDSTAYIGISTFTLNKVEVSEIGSYIDSVSNKQHLIIDVRNNGGGFGDAFGQIFSYIALKPLKHNNHSKVSKIGNFENFKYSTNRAVADTIFSGYKKMDGKDGFYSYPDRSESSINVDSLVKSKNKFKNKVYVLTNENSISAATLFPAMLVRANRGVTVGRETRTAYHFMNAVKFADIKLPNSTLTTTIPLVQAVFDDVVNDRVPYGRGVLPDYHVPFTYEELTNEKGDIILNHTLKLIEEGKYLKENPFEKIEDKISSSKEINNYIIWGSSITVLFIVFFTLRRKKKR